MGRSNSRGFSFLEDKGEAFVPPSQHPPPLYSLSLSSPHSLPNVPSQNFSLNDKINPSVLLIIIILAIVFFVSGLLHLLVRFLWRPQARDPDDLENVTALQGQLQQLFHLHDSGVDQSFIDTLPVFHYKAIIGPKNPFDCAICLCEFEAEDKLRLLPRCSHAFHMECIDTWLLSHSTCPLCRASLLCDLSSANTRSPIVLVLESGSDSSREIVPERDPNSNTVGEAESGSTRFDSENKSGGVVTVKLGKFRNVDNNGEGSSSSSNDDNTESTNVDARRCFSMGSFAYVMDENSSLQVPIRAQIKNKKKHNLPLTPGHRAAMSECDCESRRDFRFSCLDGNRGENVSGVSSSGVIGRKESLSVSKIWLRGKKEKPSGLADSSRRAVSFRLPPQGHENLKGTNGKSETRSTISEMDIEKWENGGSEFGYDDENQSCYSVDSQARAPSFARRTLLWLTGRQNKVVHSSSDSNNL